MLIKDFLLLNKKIVNKSFIFTINTANTGTGSSTNTQFVLPLTSTGTYNFTISWGDGTTNIITTYNQAEVTHTYANTGIYTIIIVGKIKGVRFNNTGDKLKVIEIKNIGCLEIDDNTDNHFSGCSNLIVSAKDFLKISGTEINFNYMFNNCTVFAPKRQFQFASNNVQNFRYTFRNCTFLNRVINLNSSSCLSFQGFLYGCIRFNSPIYVDSTNCTNMSEMFYNCSSFNQDMSFLKVANVTTMANMFTGATNLSTTNYSNFLISCASQNVQSNVTLNAVSKYNTAGETARNYLTGTKNWTITDGGIET
jgi:hypothetical protein